MWPKRGDTQGCTNVVLGSMQATRKYNLNIKQVSPKCSLNIATCKAARIAAWVDIWRSY